MTAPLPRENSPTRRPPARRFLHVLLPLVVLAVAAGVAVVLVKTSPKAQRKAPTRLARLVEVQPVRLTRQPTLVHAMGLVQPAREVALYPRVAGEIVAMGDALVPGGRVEAGQMLLQIDPTDFELALRQRESDVALARTAVALEQGQQAIAREEYALLGETIVEEDRELVLRQPQLEQVRARLAAAEAARDQARLNLERTTVKAPFNAVVRTRNVNLGGQVTAMTALATLTGNDEFWVEATVPVEQLDWLCIPQVTGETGSLARVVRETASGMNAGRTGQVFRLLPDLEKDGRMARLLITVADPLALQAENAGQPALLLGDYVRVEMDGTDLESVAAVDRRFFRDGDQLWIMNAARQLEIRPVEVAFRGREQLLVRGGLADGEHIVTTDLAAAVNGMPLRTPENTPAGAGDGPNPPGAVNGMKRP